MKLVEKVVFIIHQKINGIEVEGTLVDYRGTRLYIICTIVDLFS